MRPGALSWLGSGLSLLLLLSAGCDQNFNLRPNEQVDVFMQESMNTVDVLLVVDNSCSMFEEQEKLANNFEGFIEAFLEADTDYQIGIITTDMDSEDHAGRLQGETKIITPETEGAADLFASNVLVGTTGSGFERGLEAARAGLSEPLLSEDNAGFLRPGASLSFVFLSDEEDSSPDAVELYIDYFKSLKGPDGYRDDRMVNASAVVGDAPSGCSFDDAEGTTAAAGLRYIETAGRTGGIIDSICNDDFSPIVRELGLNISGLRRTFPLSRMPRAESLLVQVNQVDQLEGWTYREDENAVVFAEEFTPEEHAEVLIRYEARTREGGL